MRRTYRYGSPVVRWGKWVTRQGTDSPNPGGSIWLGFPIAKRAVKTPKALKRYPKGFQLVTRYNTGQRLMWRVTKEQEDL